MNESETTNSHSRYAYLVVLKGSRVGQGFPLNVLPATIGRRDTNFIPDPEDQNISRLHATIEMEQNEYTIIDNQSTNGTIVNKKKIKSHTLRDNDKIEIGNTILRFINPYTSGARLRDRVSERAHRDKLTGAYNRKRFHQMLAGAFAESELFGSPFGILLIDIDHFIKANEKHGNTFGDHVLIELAELLSSLLLEDQELYRLDDDMFAVLLSGPSARFIHDFGELIRQSVEVFDFKHDDRSTSLTVSVGIKHIEGRPPADSDAMTIIENAGQCLDIAKQKGGNKVHG